MEESRLQGENLIEIDGLTEAEAEKVRELGALFKSIQRKRRRAGRV